MTTLEFVVAISWPVCIPLSVLIIMVWLESCVSKIVHGWNDKDMEILKQEGEIDVLKEKYKLGKGIDEP